MLSRQESALLDQRFIFNDFSPDLLGLFAVNCVVGQSGSTFCNEMTGKSECCSNPNSPDVNPGLIIPNPDGDMMCYSESDKDEAEAESCMKECMLTPADLDCDAICSQTSRTLPFDPFRQYCVYAEPLPGEECKSLRPPTIDVPDVPIGPPISDFGKSIFIDLGFLR